MLPGAARCRQARRLLCCMSDGAHVVQYLALVCSRYRQGKAAPHAACSMTADCVRLQQCCQLSASSHKAISSCLPPDSPRAPPAPPPPAAARLKFRTAHPLEDCLVHTWVGHGRWIYMDLTAGGFDWGPALGGEGVVTPSSLPSAGDYFATVQVGGAGGRRAGWCCCWWSPCGAVAQGTLAWGFAAQWRQPRRTLLLVYLLLCSACSPRF